MIRRVLISLAVVAVIGAAAFWTLTSPAALSPTLISELSKPGDAQAGKAVFFASGCESCHMSPGQDDPLKLGGGQELKTPFGSFYPPNISPDAKDGIGGWTAPDFAASVLLGVSPAGEHEYPALPYPSYHHMALQDVRNLYAFMRTLAPVSGRAPPHRLAFPFSLRRLIGGWKLLFLGPPDGPQSVSPADSISYGRYLVEGPGHCGECHTPRNALGATITSLALTGAPLPEGRGKAPDISPKGLKDWSEDDISSALTTGFTPSGDTLGGPMAAVVRNLSQLPPDYAKAMARYLKQGR